MTGLPQQLLLIIKAGLPWELGVWLHAEDLHYSLLEFSSDLSVPRLVKCVPPGC